MKSSLLQEIFNRSWPIPNSNKDTRTKDKPGEHKSLPTALGGKYVDLRIHNTMNLSQNIKPAIVAPIPIKHCSYNNGIPRITWTEDDVRRITSLKPYNMRL